MQPKSVVKVHVLVFISSGPLIRSLSCVDLWHDGSETVNITVNWTQCGGDRADFYLINVSTTAPQTPYGGLLNITASNVTQHKLTGLQAGCEYNITVSGTCGGQEGNTSEPLTIFPRGMHNIILLYWS